MQHEPALLSPEQSNKILVLYKHHLPASIICRTLSIPYHYVTNEIKIIKRLDLNLQIPIEDLADAFMKLETPLASKPTKSKKKPATKNKKGKLTDAKKL